MKLGIKYNQSNDDYHKPNKFVSSSQLKLLLDDPVMFHKKYILKEVKDEHKDYFDVGNAFHTALLEPHKCNDEFITYTGIKRGAKWEEFKAKHKGKTILGNKQGLETRILINNVNKCNLAKPLLIGDSELSVYSKLNERFIKVRFDKINILEGFGMDLKSTTGQLIGSKGKFACMNKIAALDYDLSAALYLDAFNYVHEKACKQKGIEFKPLEKWYWIFSSKDFQQCRIFSASRKMLQNGRKKYTLAIKLLKQYEAANWELETFTDKIEDIDPIESDLITETSEDLEWK